LLAVRILIILLCSTLWHGGGANVTDENRLAVTFQYW